MEDNNKLPRPKKSAFELYLDSQPNSEPFVTPSYTKGPEEYKWETPKLPKGGLDLNKLPKPFTLKFGQDWQEGSSLLKSLVPHKMDIEEVKEWYNEFTRMSKELDDLIKEHTKGKEIYLLKSRRPGFRQWPPPAIYKAQWELYEKFRIIIKNKEL